MSEIKTEVLEITPAMAAKMLSRNVKNRPISKMTVRAYADAMVNDEWQLTPQGISFNQYNELIDGQHRLNAVLQANRAISFMVFYNVPQNNFKVLDTGRTRSSKDVFAIEGIKYPLEISAGIKKYYIYSVSDVVFSNSYRKRVSNTLILDIYQENKKLIGDEVLTAVEYYRRTPFYSKAEYLGIILYLHLGKKHSIEHIHGFFNQMVYGRSITYTMIEKLRERLIQSALLQSKRLYPQEKIILLKKVWNEYQKGGKMFSLNTEFDTKEGLDFI